MQLLGHPLSGLPFERVELLKTEAPPGRLAKGLDGRVARLHARTMDTHESVEFDADLVLLAMGFVGPERNGAVEALVRRGKSLLPSGIIGVSGDFDSGDAVTCTDRHGKDVAKGLVNFSSDTLRKIKGLKTAEIQKAIGAQEYEEAIHRDNLVIL